LLLPEKFICLNFCHRREKDDISLSEQGKKHTREIFTSIKITKKIKIMSLNHCFFGENGCIRQ